ncbi:MAG: polysaccharide pyruvyl transferase family protein [Pseudomonadota bacterium]
MKRNSISIGLLWHSMNSDNLGVGALSIANLAIIRGVAERLGLDPKFTILCWNDPKPVYSGVGDAEIVRLRMRDFARPNGLWRSVRACDIVFDIGAGDSFSDIYGVARISKMMLAQAAVLLAGRALIMSPQTIGPFRRPWLRRIAGAILSRATAVVVRDGTSAAVARELGQIAALTEASDVALRLPFARPAQKENGPIRVGINVSGLLFNGGYTRANMFDLAFDYADLMRQVVAYFVSQPDCEVHLIAHVQSDVHRVEDDRAANLSLASLHPRSVVAPTFASPQEAKSYIAGMDFFVGARMHACIAAFSSGVPALPMAYSRKFAGVFGSLGYNHCADCRNEQPEVILEKIKSAFCGRDHLRDETRWALSHGLQRLSRYEDVVGDRLSAAAGLAA